MKEFIIDKNNDGVRLNKFMQKVMPSVKMGEIYKALRKKKVRVNGKHKDAELRLLENDVVSIYMNDEFFESDAPDFPWLTAKTDIDIVYEDKNIIILNKPSGLVSQDEGDSLESRMRAYLYKNGEIDLDAVPLFIPSLCHRIDRNTSGLVIGAKNALYLREINERIKKREIRKFYLLKTERTPNPPSGIIEGYLKKDEKNRKMVFADDGTYCKTAYKTLKSGEPALVEAELFTGRTHQIRAGFSRLNAPLVGDVKYGAKKTADKDYQQLISYKIIFDFDDGSYLSKKEIQI